MLRKVPIIVILGSTGTGKTKLSIELAQRFGGEIISADSMQVYKGLDVATAKATKDEQSQAPHHLLDLVQPGKPFTVVDFRNAALPIAERLLAEQKIPIVVGGTNYYIESLLWKVLVNPPVTSGGGIDVRKRKLSESSDSDSSSNQRGISSNIDSSSGTEVPDLSTMTEEDMKNMESPDLHRLLKSIDPPMAERLHPNNKRKIIRALEVFQYSGIPMSQIIDEQRNSPGGSYLGGPLRYEHIIIFWLTCDQEVLNKRLDDRIDDMIGQGLLKEIRGFYDSLDNSINEAKDYTKGILQTIGFKEFIPYLEKYDSTHDEIITKFILANSQSETIPDGLKLLQTCLDELRLVTKRYSKKQLKWISNRFLSYTDRHVPPLYGLNTSTPITWKENVYLPAENIVQSYLIGETPTLKPLDKLTNPRAGLNEEVTNFCEICQRHFIGEYQWSIHLKSKKHKVANSKKKKTEQNSKCNVVNKDVET